MPRGQTDQGDDAVITNLRRQAHPQMPERLLVESLAVDRRDGCVHCVVGQVVGRTDQVAPAFADKGNDAPRDRTQDHADDDERDDVLGLRARRGQSQG